jgi:hypothetical protein
MSAHDAAPRALTADELAALPIGAVVDASERGVRARYMRIAEFPGTSAKWADGSSVSGRLVFSQQLRFAVLVTDAPIQPAPVAPLPLPTQAGERFWGKTRNSSPQWWFVQDASGLLLYVPARMVDEGEGRARNVFDRLSGEAFGLVRLPEPTETEAGA